MDRKPTAFTLVELLVVITIIGMLVALLIPAVISARERARHGVCVNRMKEIGLATVHYESVKGRLPGWRNLAPLDPTTPKTRAISWVVALFPYLDREDLWSEWRDGEGPEVAYEGVVCPSDQGNLVNAAPMNYVANKELFEDRFNSTNSTTLEGLQSTQRTVMFSERVYTDAYRVGPWNVSSDDNYQYLTFDWVGTADINVYNLSQDPRAVWGVSSNHSGGVNVCFADGHVETVAEDVSTDTFLCKKPGTP